MEDLENDNLGPNYITKKRINEMSDEEILELHRKCKTFIKNDRVYTVPASTVYTEDMVEAQLLKMIEYFLTNDMAIVITDFYRDANNFEYIFIKPRSLVQWANKYDITIELLQDLHLVIGDRINRGALIKKYSEGYSKFLMTNHKHSDIQGNEYTEKSNNINLVLNKELRFNFDNKELPPPPLEITESNIEE